VTHPSPRTATIARTAGLAALFLFALPLFVLLGQPSGSPTSTGPTLRERDLAEIRRQIDRLEGELSGARARERDLASTLEAAELDLALQEQRVAEASAAREVAEEEVARTEAEVASLAAELGTARQSLEKRMVGLYRLGRNGPLRLALSIQPEGGGSGSDLPSAVRLLRYLVRRDADAVDRYVVARESLLDRQRVLEEERREVERWLAEAESRRTELASARRRQATLLARARDERRELDRRTEDLAQKERQLSSLIASLAGDGEPLSAASGESGASIEEFRGVLDWPVPGEVTIGFGPRTDPRYRTRVPHNGLEIAPAQAVERDGEGRVRVAAVYPGEVLYAAPFEGYGRTVVVHHAGRVFTLYAGLDELLVEPGQVLELGAPVGTASGRVYFEVRKENRPEDPLGWLR
jgi:septal ring factor EnvC (AmiA/AmiB activator)